MSIEEKKEERDMAAQTAVMDRPTAQTQDLPEAAQTAEPWRPKILAFCCNWCTYAGADLAGLNRMNYPADIRLLRVPCSGRVNPQFVLRALEDGCDGVLVCGCHPGDCHYVSGNYYAKRRMMIFKRMLEFSGLEPNRFQIRWISGSEAGKFRDTVMKVTQDITELGPMANDAPSLAALAAADAQLALARTIEPDTAAAAAQGGDR